MLALPGKKDIDNLKKTKGDYCISFYMPADEDSLDSHAANRIRFKNLVSDAQQQLTHGGMSPKEASAVLEQAKELLDDSGFWNIRRNGLAVFIKPTERYVFAFPGEKAPTTFTIAERFDLQPLQKVMKGNHKYYVLALGHKDVQLLEGDKFQLHDVTPDELPTDMKKALNIDEQPSHLSNHEVAPVRGAQANRSFHGQYNVKEEDKKDLVNYFRLLDKKINGLMRRAGNPTLILAGVDYLLPLYQQANTYVNLSRQHISKNIRHMKPKEILDDIRPMLSKRSLSSA